MAGRSTCRYCLNEDCSKNLTGVYTWNGNKEVFSEMISETFNINIVSSDSTSPEVSHMICDSCIGRLRDASDFKKQVSQCEQTLQRYLHQPSESISKMLRLHMAEIDTRKDIDCCIKEEQESYENYEQPASQEVLHCNDNAEGEAETEMLYDLKEDTAVGYDDEIVSKDLSLCIDEDDGMKIPKEEPLFENPETMHVPNRRSARKTKAKSSTANKSRKNKSSNTSVRNTVPKTGNNNDSIADDVVRRNSIAILRHTTAYPFQPTKTSFRCCFCPYTPSNHDPIAFRNHMDTTHEQTDKSTCLKHHNESMRRIDITNLKCKKIQCFTPFKSLEDIAKHLVEIHNENIDLSQCLGLVPIRLEKDKFACVICSKSYSTLHQLSRHSGTHFYRNICYKCGSNFETLKGLKKHVLVSHSNSKYICQKCKTPFQDLKTKKEHLRDSKKCQSFKCKICKETFLCLESQQAHLVKAHGKAKVTYKCPECGDIFEKRINRYLHFKMAHTDDFKCSYCGTKFSNNRCLQDHIARIHTFERRYRCNICDKAFIDARTLRTHTFIHDDSKKQHCPVCNRGFTIKIRLKYHVQKYHPDILTDIFPNQPNG